MVQKISKFRLLAESAKDTAAIGFISAGVAAGIAHNYPGAAIGIGVGFALYLFDHYKDLLRMGYEF